MNYLLQPNEYFIHAYNDTASNERCIEVALGIRYYEHFEGNIVEVGNVLPCYGFKQKHLVIDPFDSYIKGVSDEFGLAIDAEQYDFTGKNVLSISTIEHMGTSSYMNPTQDIEKPVRFIRKLIKEAASFFISIPVGCNKALDSALQNDLLKSLDWFAYHQFLRKRWFFVPGVKDSIASTYNYKYGSPYQNANAVVFIRKGI